MAIRAGKYTTAESIAALSLTVEKAEEWERDNSSEKPMSKYGDLFRNYLKEHHPDRYDFLVSEMEVYDVCRAVDDEAREMMITIQNQLRAKNPRPQNDFMATVRYETAIRDQAEEYVLREIVHRIR